MLLLLMLVVLLVLFCIRNVMSRFGLDRHMASAYLISLRGLKLVKSHDMYKNFTF